jgi:MFS family permease
MTPLVIAPFAASAGRVDIAIVLTLTGVCLFHFFRGIGMVANNPVLSYLAQGSDRGSYMTQIQIINNAVGMVSGLAIAMLLGGNAPLYIYAVIVAAGIAFGITSGNLMGRIPEPAMETRDGERKCFIPIVKEALREAPVKNFIIIILLVALVSGVSRIFIVVYARDVFLQSDGMVSLYTVFGGLGTLIIGLFIKFFVDRIGAKPIFIFCTAAGFISIIPIIFFPEANVSNPVTAILFLTFLFFIMNFAFIGAENVGQTYFLALVPKDNMLDMGVLYFLVFGVAGAGGSFLTGVLLDALSGAGLSGAAAFKVLFIILASFLILTLFLQRKLVALGSLSVRDSLEVLFSYRDLRAISLLDKLNKTADAGEEEALLGELHDSPSQLAISGLLARIKSPRFVIRLESLRAIGALKNLSAAAEKVLMDDIISNPYTTAYYSARILGEHRMTGAIPLLRELVYSDDYMLSGESMISLAKLEDTAFLPNIEKIIIATQNPRLKIMGVESLGIYKSIKTLPALFEIMLSQSPPPYLREETVLAMSAIIDTQQLFYKILVRYLADQSLAATLGIDEAESAYEYYKSIHGGAHRGKQKKAEAHKLAESAEALQNVVSAYMLRDVSGPAAFSRWILSLPRNVCDTAVQLILAEAVLEDEVNAYDRIRLLVTHWAARCLRIWANALK